MMAASVGSSVMVELIALCGEEHVVGVEGGIVSVAPATTEEVAAVLQWANERGFAVMAQGGGTKLGWCGGGGGALLLRMHRMNRVLEHVWQDMTCTVEAGCTWATMQGVLAGHGQFVALDPVFAERASVGGICAVNDSGALRLKYGSLRDLVIGMTVVLADGTVAKTGGKVVKNVAGYDLHKLMLGAFGTLAVVTEVTFRLHSLPRYTRSFTVGSNEAQALGTMLLRVIDSHLSVQRLQMRCGTAGYSLDLALSTVPEVVASQAVMLETMVREAGLMLREAVDDVWDLRQGLFEEVGAFVVKVTMLPSEIAFVAAAVHELGGRSLTQAVGVMIASVPPGEANGLQLLRRQVELEGGSMVVLQQAESSSLDRWGTLPDTLPVMRAIKRQFDPKRILNPGEWMGGL